MRARWALAPRGRVAHWFYPFADTDAPDQRDVWMAFKCSQNQHGFARRWRQSGTLRPPGDAKRCAKCVKLTGKK